MRSSSADLVGWSCSPWPPETRLPIVSLDRNLHSNQYATILLIQSAPSSRTRLFLNVTVSRTKYRHKSPGSFIKHVTPIASNFRQTCDPHVSGPIPPSSPADHVFRHDQRKTVPRKELLPWSAPPLQIVPSFHARSPTCRVWTAALPPGFVLMARTC